MAIFNSLIVVFVVILCIDGGAACLSANYYTSACPRALPTIKAAVEAAVRKEKRMGASLLRLHFHDCFVNGCDASVLLDDTANFTGEKTAQPNANSIRGFEVVDTIKAQVEKLCPRTVSCADILAVAARDSVVALGGPTWKVRLGRRDSTTANLTAANIDIPPPTSNITTLLRLYANKGLSPQDLVALSGGHTIGLAKCRFFRDRLYNDTDINPSFANSLRSGCPRVGNNDTLFPLDAVSPTVFDNDYFKNLVSQRGLLHSDQILYSSSGTSSIVSQYNSNSGKFLNDFKLAMIKMGNIRPLTGKQGQIRVNCRKVN